MSIFYKELNAFLTEHCEVKHFVTEAAAGVPAKKERCYLLPTEGCLLFMAEAYVQDMRNAVGQSDDAGGDTGYSEIILYCNWGAPEAGMNALRIPVKLIESLDDKQTLIILRCLEGIQKDIDIGHQRMAVLQTLFRDTATIKPASNLESERIYIISGKTSASDRRRYAERYAELVATNVLFNLPKALNARLQKIVPKDARGKFFVEGRDIASPKIRYGANAHVELVLTDEGAQIYTELAQKNATLKESIGALFRQAMTDPFGLSLKYYMGKHALIKLAGKK